MMTDGRGRRFDAVDAATVELVRLVLDDDWTAVTAAARLRDRVQDAFVLRRARARVLSASAERTGPVSERAIETLDLALHPIEPQTASVLPLDDAGGAGSPR